MGKKRRYQKDFHGLFPNEALQKADNLLYQVRKTKQEEIWNFITGTGPLQNTLILWCNENKLRYEIIASNLGVIQVWIE